MIRWISTEIRIFAYVNNLVLLACFLGIGIGCYYSHKPARLTTTLVALLLLLSLVTAPLFVTFEGTRFHLAQDIPTLLSAFPDSIIWFEAPSTGILRKVIAGTVATVIIVVLIAATFVPLGQVIGKLLDEHDNLIFAYSLNVIASLAGIWMFNALSFQLAPPWLWFVFPVVIMAVLTWQTPKSRIPVAAILLGYLVVLVAMGTHRTAASGPTVWSPYQKLRVEPFEPNDLEHGYLLTVNDIGFMEMLNF